jgi:hypothetical protein
MIRSPHHCGADKHEMLEAKSTTTKSFVWIDTLHMGLSCGESQLRPTYVTAPTSALFSFLADCRNHDRAATTHHAPVIGTVASSLQQKDSKLNQDYLDLNDHFYEKVFFAG